ncbi:hypothetical protein GBA52_011809 [Prunus armeniaca]|nr:hypothetical protein GBA52_011809 [Prunus armeniaca]
MNEWMCSRILLPKFGEWDVNNPASAEGFTVIFTKARDQKMSSGAPGTGTPSSKPEPNSQYPPEGIEFLSSKDGQFGFY